jgi:hypothetical protein
MDRKVCPASDPGVPPSHQAKNQLSVKSSLTSKTKNYTGEKGVRVSVLQGDNISTIFSVLASSFSPSFWSCPSNYLGSCMNLFYVTGL